MATLRGARILSSLGCKSINIGRLHQKRLTSLALPALVQCNLKISRRFNDMGALPVNKYDLKGIGLTTVSSALFSTESFEALADEASNDVQDNDCESGMERKWPSPISQVARNHNSAFVGGYALDFDQISSVLSQFGEIKSVRVPLRSLYESNPDNTEAYRYAFVDFASAEGLSKALTAGSLTLGDKTIEIKAQSKSRQNMENDRTFIVDKLPCTITVNEINEYFNSFGNVALVNLVLNSMTERKDMGQISEYPRNYAFIVFDSTSDVTSLHEKEHTLQQQSVTVSKVNKKTRLQRRDRCRKILLEGIGESLDENKIRNFFNEIAPVKDVSILLDRETGLQRGLAVVFFEDKDGAISASQEDSYEIDGCNIKIKALGLVNE